jgi:hypothetical protein
MFAEDRESIAVALSTVDGVVGRAARPAVPERGDAWPVLASVERGPGQAWRAAWQVLVVLEGDEEAATGQMDALLPVLADALAGTLYVDRGEPATIETPAGRLLALRLEGVSE